MILVCDTGPLAAAANVRDNRYEECAFLLDYYPGRLVVPSLVVTETAYIIRERVGPRAEAEFVDSIADGLLPVENLINADWQRTRELMHQYLDMRLGVVDAAVVAVAERLGTDAIASINPRDFRAIRPLHTPAFRLLPLDGWA